MWSFGVRGVMLASFPDFVKQKSAGIVGAAMKVVLQTAFFLARGIHQRPQLSFEQKGLTIFGAKKDDIGQRAFREFGDFCTIRFAGAGPRLGSPFHFSSGHNGGDCTPNRMNGKNIRDYWSLSLRPTFKLSKFIKVFRTNE
jgi:hypothetical protein